MATAARRRPWPWLEADIGELLLRAPLRWLGFAAGAALLTGCLELGETGDQPESAAHAAAPLTEAETPTEGPAQVPMQSRPRLVLVTDPAVFRAEDTLLWDGEETMRGHWIAVSGLVTARRVRVTNAATGAYTDAAMFRREKAAPGPHILVSSEAAGALGLVPGETAEVVIEALTYADPTLAALQDRSAGADELAASPIAEESEAGAKDLAADQNQTLPKDAPAEDEAPAVVSGIYGGEGAEGDDPGTAGGLTALIGAAFGSLSLGGDSAEDHTPDQAAPDEATTGAETVTAGAANAALAESRQQAPAPEPQAEAPLFIRAGTFERPAEAEALATDLRDAGLKVEIRAPGTDEAEPIQVLVGPFENDADRAAAMERLRALAIDDAKPVKG